MSKFWIKFWIKCFEVKVCFSLSIYCFVSLLSSIWCVSYFEYVIQMTFLFLCCSFYLHIQCIILVCFKLLKIWFCLLMLNTEIHSTYWLYIFHSANTVLRFRVFTLVCNLPDNVCLCSLSSRNSVKQINYSTTLISKISNKLKS